MRRATRTGRWRSWLCRGVLAGVFVIAAFSAVSWTIGSGVRAASGVAQRAYGGDQVSALMALAQSPMQTLRDRNRAVWALGQLGDARALTVLERHYTGKPCEHDRELCQQELEKAIRLCRGGLNVPALLWRDGVPIHAKSS